MHRAIGLLVFAASCAYAQDDGSPVIAPFSRVQAGGALPAGWRSLTFENIAETTRYTLVRDGDTVVLRAEADASASAVVHRLEQPSSTATMLRWRWKADTLPVGSDVATKARDDAVARIYVTFEVAPEKLGRMERLKYRALRAFYGEDAPHASIIYVWDNRAAVGARGISPYTDRARTVVVESGSARVGRWIDYERDVLADYRTLFRDDPPRITGIGLMTDADNTRSRALAWYGDVTLRTR